MSAMSLARTAAALVALIMAGCGSSSQRHEKNATAAQAAVCLRKEGARVSGDPGRRPPGDADAPDRELVAALKGAGAFIAFYASEARAKALEPGIRKNADRFKGVVVRDRNTTVVYTKKPPDDVRKRIEACLF
jgi:hypothetical protein